MRIAIITEGYLPELSGVTISLYNRLKWLSKMGHSVNVYAPDYKELSSIYPDYKKHIGDVIPGIKIIPFPSKPYYVPNIRDPKPFSFRFISKSIREFKPNVIHCECPERLFMGFMIRPGISLAKELRIPVTAFYHTNYLSYIQDYKNQVKLLRLPGIEALLKKILIWVYNSYAFTMVPSKITSEYLTSLGVINTKHACFLGIDTGVFNPYNTKEISLLKPFKDKVKIIYIGRLAKDKQIAKLLDIFDLVSKKTTKCAFIIAGDGEEETRVREWAKSRTDAVYIGKVPNEKTPIYYNSADIFVTASPKENHPLTILEAMACRLPVIGPGKGGVGEMINNSLGGIAVSSCNTEAFSEAINRLTDNIALRLELAENALIYSQKHSWEHGINEMLKIWMICVQ